MPGSDGALFSGGPSFGGPSFGEHFAPPTIREPVSVRTCLRWKRERPMGRSAAQRLAAKLSELAKQLLCQNRRRGGREAPRTAVAKPAIMAFLELRTSGAIQKNAVVVARCRGGKPRRFASLFHGGEPLDFSAERNLSRYNTWT